MLSVLGFPPTRPTLNCANLQLTQANSSSPRIASPINALEPRRPPISQTPPTKPTYHWRCILLPVGWRRQGRPLGLVLLRWSLRRRRSRPERRHQVRRRREVVARRGRHGPPLTLMLRLPVRFRGRGRPLLLGGRRPLFASASLLPVTFRGSLPSHSGGRIGFVGVGEDYMRPATASKRGKYALTNLTRRKLDGNFTTYSLSACP